MKLCPESEIMSHWPGDLSKPVVSVCCITFNHEKFITEAIGSFLMQETDFPFEILINDDASTDNTAEIIRKHVRLYPRLIKPILQTENQYSKGIRINPVFNFSRAKGKYLALCEGDDYWTDKHKLQIQVQSLEKNPEINLSFHPSIQISFDKRSQIISDHSNKNKIFSASEIILGDGSFCPTSSLLIRKKSVENLPDWFYSIAPVGDYFLQIIASAPLGAYYINKIMSCYRLNGTGWTISRNSEEIKNWLVSMSIALKKLDNDLKKRYTAEINSIISKFFLFDIHNEDELIKKIIQQELSLFKIAFKHKQFIHSFQFLYRIMAKVQIILFKKFAKFANKTFVSVI